MTTYKKHLKEEISVLASEYGQVLETLAKILEAAQDRKLEEVKELKPSLVRNINGTHNGIKRLNNLINAMPEDNSLTHLLDNDNPIGI